MQTLSALFFVLIYIKTFCNRSGLYGACDAAEVALEAVNKGLGGLEYALDVDLVVCPADILEHADEIIGRALNAGLDLIAVIPKVFELIDVNADLLADGRLDLAELCGNGRVGLFDCGCYTAVCRAVVGKAYGRSRTAASAAARIITAFFLRVLVIIFPPFLRFLFRTILFHIDNID